MRGRGLMGGLPESPMSAAGRGIGEAFDTGLNAYATAKRIGLAERQDQREGKRLDMAAQLQPQQMKNAELEGEERQLRVREAATKADQEANSRRLAAGIMEKCRSGKCDPEELQLDFLNFAVSTNDPAHFRQALGEYRAVTEKGRIGDETRAMLTNTAPLFEKAMRTRSLPDIMALQAELTKYPRASGHGFVNAAGKAFQEALTAQLPQAPADAVREYAGMKVARPDLKPEKVWELTVGMNRQAATWFEQNPTHMPYEVRKGRKISESVDAKRAEIPVKVEEQQAITPGKVEEARATKAATEPIDTKGAVTKIRATGEEARKTEVVRHAGRVEIKKASTHAEAIALVRTSEHNLASLRRLRAQVYEEERRDVDDQIAEETYNLGQYRKQLDGIAGSKAGGAASSGRPGPRTDNAPSAPLKGIRASILKEARSKLQKSTSIARSQTYLDFLRDQNQISQEEHDNLMAAERRRFGGR